MHDSFSRLILAAQAVERRLYQVGSSITVRTVDNPLILAQANHHAARLETSRHRRYGQPPRAVNPNLRRLP